LTRLFVRHGSSLPLGRGRGFRPGEAVRVGVEPRWLLRAAAFIYLGPLLAFLAGVLAGHSLWPGRDGMALLAGLLGAGLGLLLLRTPPAHLSRPRLSLERIPDEPVRRLESGRCGAHLDHSGK
jgi:positive regulator of sigma E activity